METGTTTGRKTIWLELSDTRESTTEITNIMSPCCWQTSTKSKCFTADDTKPTCAATTKLVYSLSMFDFSSPHSRWKNVIFVFQKTFSDELFWSDRFPFLYLRQWLSNATYWDRTELHSLCFQTTTDRQPFRSHTAIGLCNSSGQHNGGNQQACKQGLLLYYCIV